MYLRVKFAIHPFDAEQLGNIVEWRYVCTELGNHVPPLQLSVSLEFIQKGSDKKNLATIKTMLDSMLKLPLLEEVTLKIDGRDIAGLPLHNKACQVLNYLVIPAAPAGPVSFDRFMDLPIELQLMILEYTDLGLLAPGAVTPSGLKGFALLKCYEGACPNSGSNEYGDYEWCSERTVYHSSRMCWSLPLDLFLVNKAFSELSSFIFFSQNHFVIPVTNSMLDSYRPQQRLVWNQTSVRFPDNWDPQKSQFLSNFPLECAPHVRSLEFRFPMLGDVVTFNPGGAYDWSKTVDFISQNMRLSDLSITLGMETTDVHPRHRRYVMRDVEVAKMSREEVVTPMIRLRDLRDFSVIIDRSQTVSTRAFFEELRLERLAMGPNFHLTAEEQAAGRIFEFDVPHN